MHTLKCVRMMVKTMLWLTGVYAYVTLKMQLDEEPEQIIDELKSLVRSKIAAYAVPEIIQVRAHFYIV